MIKKKVPLWTVAAITAFSILLTAIFSLQLCYRYMYLPERERANRFAVEISEKYEPSDKNALPEKFKAVYEYFVKHYTGKLDKEKLETALLKQFFALTGDSYAQYYTVEEYDALDTSYNGQNVGIGIYVAKSPEGRMLITYVEEDSPAKKSGILVGNEIIAVDGQSLSEIGYDRASSLLRGEIGSEAVFTVASEGGTHEYSITREKYQSKSVRFSLESDHVGYVRILSFGNKTFEEFKTAVDLLIEEGAEVLVFDLRDNGGGILSSVHKVLDYLIEDGSKEEPNVVLTTVDALDNQKRYLCTDGHAINLPMAVLTNGSTASAAELFTAALRDYDMAIIVGSKTYGKGVAQSTIKLDDGTAFKMTTSFYNPPCGVNYDKIGITPDLSVDTEGINFNLFPISEDQIYLTAVGALKK